MTGTRIGIIGAGVSGRLLALNLIERAPPDATIYLIDRREPRYMGPAYSDNDAVLLLNVPAGRMGAFSQEPEHFLHWARARGISAESTSFLPRALFRDYVLDLTEAALAARADRPTCMHVRGEVRDIEPMSDGASIHFVEHAPLRVDSVVLALGNFPPPDPTITTTATLRSPHYVGNPWDMCGLDSLAPDDDVLLIGSGQTTVDIVAALDRRAHRGRIISLSRRGLWPLSHRRFDSYPSYVDEIPNPARVRSVLRTVRDHLSRADAAGFDIRPVIDALRPDTQALWAGFPEREKRRFLRHAFRYWEIIRSRLAPENQAIIERLREAGQLETVAGRLVDLVDGAPGIDVHYRPRGASVPVVRHVALAVNCMGPELAYRRLNAPLIQSLFRRGLIRSGPADLGIDANLGGAVRAEDGRTSNWLFAIGPTMSSPIQ
jgi:uncharacterized NAD(P)/FAD-binding protein YdhS